MSSISSKVIAFPAHAIKCPPGALALHPAYDGEVLVVSSAGTMRRIRVEEHIPDAVPNTEGLCEEEAAEVLCSETILTFEAEVCVHDLRELRPARDVGALAGRDCQGLGLFDDEYPVVIAKASPKAPTRPCFVLIDGGK